MKLLKFFVVSALSSLLIFATVARAESMFDMLAHAVVKQVQVVTSSAYGSSKSVHSPSGHDNSLFGEPDALENNAFCTAQYFDGTLPQIENAKLRNKTKLGCFDHFSVMHSGMTRTPLWSAEHLTRTNLAAASKLPREDSFHPESKLPASERAELSDYQRSGLDRGHLSPNADSPDTSSQGQSFSLANIVPQNSDNNRRLHAGIESAVRAWAKQSGELYVVTGPLFLGEHLSTLHNRVIIPTHIFKAVYDPSSRVASVYVEKNEPGMDYETVSIAELQRLSGIDFFPSLPDQVKRTVHRLPAPILHH